MTWLIDTLIVTGALIALVLVLRRPVARAFGPGLAYALWLLPLLRLVLPPLVLPAPAEAPAEVVTVVASAPAAASAAPAFDWQPLVLGLWLAGAAAYLAWRALGYAEFRRNLLRRARPVGWSGKVRLVETPDAPGPVAFGLIDRIVALPPGFMAQHDRTARDLAIAHELEHHAGRDLAINLAMQPLLALHWFNPLAWIGWRALRRDQEAACDARVLAARAPSLREAYGRMIAVHALRGQPGLAAALACPIAAEKNIVYRLRSLTMNEPSPRRRLLGRALIGAGAVALPLTATITYAAADEPKASEPQVRTVKKIMIVDHQDGAAHDEDKLVTRVIERDGKTIVLKTSKPLSDAEAEAALAGLPELPEPPAPPVPPAPPAAPDGKQVRRVMVIEGGAAPMVMSHDGKDGPRVFVLRRDGKDGGAHAMALAGDGAAIACKDGKQASAIDAEENKDGKRQIVRMRFCSAAGAEANAGAALRKARERISADTNLSPEVKARVLEQLDAEIAKAG